VKDNAAAATNHVRTLMFSSKITSIISRNISLLFSSANVTEATIIASFDNNVRARFLRASFQARRTLSE